jgi:hypothetical protein
MTNFPLKKGGNKLNKSKYQFCATFVPEILRVSKVSSVAILPQMNSLYVEDFEGGTFTQSIERLSIASHKFARFKAVS